MRNGRRDRVRVRASRGYLAGFGTSGSLLAGAAALFLVGSAIVAFDGWPQAATGAANSNVAAGLPPASSRTARRLTVALASTRPRSAARPTALAHGRLTGAKSVASSATRPRTQVEAVTLTTAPASPASSSTGGIGGVSASPGSGTSPCGSCGTARPKAVTDATHKVTQGVSSAGTDVGQQVTGLSGTAANQLNPVSPPVANAVQAAGSTAANAVTATANAVANAVSTVGSVLGGRRR